MPNFSCNRGNNCFARSLTAESGLAMRLIRASLRPFCFAVFSQFARLVLVCSSAKAA